MIANLITKGDRILLDGRAVTITNRDEHDGHILLFGISEWPGRIWLGKAEDVQVQTDHWTTDPGLLADWQYQTANGDTLLGYHEWVAHEEQIAAEMADLDGATARIQVVGADVLYCVLDGVFGEPDWNDGADYRRVIDAFLARFPNRDSLLRWTAAAIDAKHNSWLDTQRNWWTAEMGEVDDYAKARVHELLTEGA